MKQDGRENRGKTGIIATLVLIIIIVAGAVSIGLRYEPDEGIILTHEVAPSVSGSVYIGGGVNAPGHYPVYDGDTLDDLISAAGGLSEGAEVTDVRILVEENDMPQRVNLNTADAWLLAALPGIGPERAAAIVNYRETHGRFRDIHEITNVESIGEGIYEEIRNLITVSD